MAMVGGTVGMSWSKKVRCNLHMSHLLNPCVHVKQGAPCKAVA